MLLLPYPPPPIQPPGPAFDAAGTGFGSTATAPTWAHTIGGNCLLVGVHALSLSTTNPTATATIGGTTVPAIGSAFEYYATWSATLFLFGMLNPPTGAQTIGLTITGSTANNGVSLSYNDVTSIGATSTASGTGTALSQTASTPGAEGGYLVNMLGAAGGTANMSGYSQTERFNNWVNGTNFPLIMGDAQIIADSTVFSASAVGNTRGWGSLTVQLA